ncbi:MULTISPECIES: hypothetical protein [unclassified Streptomyces]|uniref:hypothetical protein n=1 Tax=unclassified Streptomyces TaxID=2593676 RepID=UPI0022528126|nr:MULTISPECIES: hypothetical protein [unclassified Streptomyces]MCX4650245.1 hypothetical protein [Streptomyces sp. NBC_01446]MCX5327758.1 hypothetical protein [Streptomyces sp. NBC_00120]
MAPTDEIAPEYPYINVTIDTRGMQPLARRATGNIAIVGAPGTGVTVTPNIPVQIGSEAEAREHFAVVDTKTRAVTSAGPLYRALCAALLQDPAPSRVYAVPTGPVETPPGGGGPGGEQPAAAAPDYDAALKATESLPVQLVCLAGETGVDQLKRLKEHVDNVSEAGSARMGVGMVDPDLPLDPTDEDRATFAAAAASTYTDVKSGSSRMILVAARVEKDKETGEQPDVAAAVTGAIAGYPPHASVLMKQVRGFGIPLARQFSGTEIKNLAEKLIIPVIDPELIPGEGLFLGSGHCFTTETSKLFVDIVRVLDHIEFQLKAGLIGSIGETRIDRLGMQGLKSRINGILSPLLTSGIIAGYTIDIPLLPVLEAEESARTPGQTSTLSSARRDRTVEVLLSVTYAGAVHFLDINLALKA